MKELIENALGFYVPTALCLVAIIAVISCVVSLIRTQKLQRKRIMMEIDEMTKRIKKRDIQGNVSSKNDAQKKDSIHYLSRTVYVNPDNDGEIDEFFHAMDDAFGEANKMFSEANRMFEKSENLFKKGK